MRPIRHPKATIQAVGEEILVLNEDRSTLTQLNPTAAWLFNRCDGKRTFDQIVEEFTAEVDVAANVAHHDLLQALTQMSELNIVELLEGAG